jgi:predicted Zn-dependent protease
METEMPGPAAEEGRESSGIRRRRKPILLLTLVVCGLLWSGWNWREGRRHRLAIAEVKAEIREARYGTAARKLDALLAREPDWAEAVYLLGTCEQARGRGPQAAKAWTRVPPGSAFGSRAIQGLMDLEVQAGRLADAERLILKAMDAPRIDGSGLPLYLGPIYSLQGRHEEAERAVEARWDHLDASGEGASEKAINLVRLYIELRQEPIPTEAVDAFLDQAGRQAPDDDRVWLGKANQAIRVGSYDDAARRLDACLSRRPEDVPVWRARLKWAIARDRVAEVLRAAKHLPARESTPGEVHRLAAWLAARRGDLPYERRALERLHEADPADLAALDRLGGLADKEGQPARAAAFRREKADLDPITARYQKLYRRNQPRRDATEMARLAGRLGRWFEARAFLTVAAAAEPDNDTLRHDIQTLNKRARIADQGGRTLADLLDEDQTSIPAGSSSRS